MQHQGVLSRQWIMGVRFSITQLPNYPFTKSRRCDLPLFSVPPCLRGRCCFFRSPDHPITRDHPILHSFSSVLLSATVQTPSSTQSPPADTPASYVPST